MSLCVPFTTTCKHFASSININATNFIFQLIQIPNLPTLVVQTPLRSPCTPSIDYVHLFVDYVNSSINYGNTFVDCIKFYVECANKSNDYVNILDD